MAPGYVVAALLEAAGLIGLVVAMIVMRTERAAKAAELRSFLRSGQTALPDALAGRRPVAAPRVVDVPIPLPGPGPVSARDSAARSALGRAIARGDRRPGDRIGTPISAG